MAIETMSAWKIISPGRRRDDGWVAINLAARRICFQGFSERKASNILEPLSLDFRLRRVGVYVWIEGWSQPYVLKKRSEWRPDDYFIHAARLMGERGLETRGGSNG